MSREGADIDWAALETRLRAAGYAVDRQGDDRETVLMVTVPADVPSLSGGPGSVVGRLLELLPGVRVPTDPSVVPADLRATAAEYGATVEVHSGNRTELHVVVSADGVW